MVFSLRRSFFILSLLLTVSTVAFSQAVVILDQKKDACDGANNGSIQITVTSGVTPLSYFIYGIGFGDNYVGGLTINNPITIGGLRPDTYLIAINDGDPAINYSSSFTINNLTTPLNVTQDAGSPVNNSSCITPNGQISLTTTGGSGSYTYSWTGPSSFTATTEDLTGLAGGAYNLTVRDANTNCSRTLSVNVSDPSPAIYNVAPPVNRNICVGSDLPIVLTGSEPSSNPVSYEVLRNGGGTGIIQAGTGSPLLFTVPAGTFNTGDLFIIRATNGFCTPATMNGVVNVTIVPLPTATISGTAPICVGGSTTLTFTLPASGTYNVVYTDGTTNFNANNIANGATVSVSPTANTTYTIVSVTNTATNCVSTAPSANISGSAIITVNPLPTAAIAGNTIICPGGTAPLTFTLPAGTYNVVYTDGITNFNANGIVNGAVVNVAPGASATYTIVSVTNTATSCVSTAPSPNITGSAAVTVNPLPTANISGTTTICSGLSTTLTFTLSPGIYDLVYSDGTTNTTLTGISSGATISVTPAANTTYTIVSIVNTTSPSCAVTAPSPNITGSAIISVNPSPTASISGNAVICEAGVTNLTFTLPTPGTFDVVYTDGASSFNLTGISNGATISVSPTANTVYTILSVTNPLTTCTSTAPSPNITGSASVTVNPLPTASISGSSTICLGGSTALTFTLPSPGTFNVVYTDGTTNFNANGISSGATVSVNPAANTTYTIVSVTNTATTCTVTAPNAGITGSAVISVNPVPTASISGSSTICQGGSGTLTFTLPAGTYDVVYTDGTTTFNSPGISSGATVSVSPVANATYTIVSVTNTATTCSVTAPSANITGSAVISVNLLPVASISGTNTICVGGNTNLTFTLPAGTYDVVYTDGVTNFNATGITNGAVVPVAPAANTTYTIVSVTNTATTCTVSAPSANITGTASITVNPLPTASISGTTTICAGGAVALTFTLSAGTYDVVYTDGITNFTANGLVSGSTVNVNPAANATYTIVSILNTSVPSCTVTAPSANITGSATITVNPLPTASISGTSTICAGGNATLTFTLPAGTYDVVYSDGVTPVTLSGIVNGATVSVTPTANATYTITSVTNIATTCTLTAPHPNITGGAIVTVNPAPTAVIAGTASICSGAATQLTFTLPATGTYDVVYTDGTTNFNAPGISNGATVSVTPLANSTYTIVSVTNTATTCTVTAPSANITGSAIISVSPLPTANIAGTATICQGAGATLTFTLPAVGTFDVVYTDGTTIFNAPGIANGATASVSPTANATYTIVSVTNSGTSCTATAPSASITGSAIITVIPAPTANIAGTATLCQGANATLTFTLPATGTYDIVYTDGTTNFNASGIANGATVSVSPASTTTYTIVSVTTTGSSCTITAPSPNITGSAIVTVTPLPTASINGTTTVCQGSSATLTFTLPATGTYNVVYTDGTTTFNANAIANGATVSVSPAANATYTIVSVTTVGTTCIVSAPSPNITGSAVITVTPASAGSISGTATICAGAATNLTFTLDPGSYNVVYTDGTTNFTANGISTGATVSVSPTATVTYTIASLTNILTTCVVTAPSPNLTGSALVTVNPSPTATISGTTSICTGTSTSLTVTFTGTGPWSFRYTDGTTTSPVIPSFFNTISIPISPTTSTTYTLVSAGDATSCPGIVSGSAIVTVNQNPTTNLTVGTTINPLCSGGISDVTVSNSEIGVSYQLRNDAGNINLGAPVLGTGSTITLSTGVLTATTTFNVLATAGGCTPAELNNMATITVAGAINAALAVASDANPICAGSAANVQVTASENGVLYQLRNDATNTPIGSAVAGTGGTISLPTGNLAATTTFNVLASNGTCSIELTDIETVTVGASPNATLAVNVTLDPLCSGGVSDVTVALSQVGVTYQLRNDAGDVNIGSPAVGTGGLITLSTGALTATTTFNVLASSTGCPAVELTTLATVNVSGTVNAGLSVSAATDPICAGTSTNIQIDLSETGVTYQLRDDATNNPIGAPVAGTGGTILISTGNLAATSTFNVLANNGACSIELTDTQTVTVNVAPDPTLAVSATLNPLCGGGVSDVTVALSQVGVSYQLRNDAGDINIGAAAIGTGGTIFLSTGVLNATTTFNVVATSGVCAAVELTNLATVTVTGTLNAGLTVSSSAASICAGSGTFIQVQASETGVNYQLRNDANDAAVGAPITGTGGTINIPTGNLTVTTTFNVVANNGSCSIELTDKETITVNPSPNLGLSVSSASALICPGNATNIIVTNSEIGISYQLRNNIGNALVGSAVAGTGGNILLPSGTLAVNTTFNVLAIAGTCSAQLTATTTVTIRPVGDPACGGSGGTDCTNFNAIVPTITTQPSCNDRDAGIVSFSISRADASATTFRVIWTFNGGTPQTKFTSNTVAFNDLSSGLYQYTVIDEGNGKTCGPVDFFLDLKTQVNILTKQVTSNVTCFGGTDGNAILSVDGSTTGEYWYRYVLNGNESGAQTFTPGAPLPGGLPADDNAFIIIKVDDNFNFTCPDTVMVRIKNTFAKIDYTTSATNVTTCNGTDGGIQVTAIGGGDSGTIPLQIRLKRAVPFSTDPSGYVVVADYENVAAGAKTYTGQPQGNYVIDIRDHNDCVQSKPIAIQAPGQVPLSSVSITAADANCANNGQSGTIRISISDPGIYKVALSQDQLNVPADADFVDYSAPSLPSIIFNNLASGAYYVYIKSSTTTCPTRTDAIMINGVKALADFEVLSNCTNVNLTVNNITGQTDAPFVIRVFNNNDKFFKIDSLAASAIPLSNSVSFINSASQHTFLVNPGTYRFVMVQTQTTGTGSCALVSDTVVYAVRELLGITLGQVKPSYPTPKHTGSIEIANITGGTRFVSANNELYYEISLTTGGDDIVVTDWTRVKLDTQNKFVHLFEYLPPGVYTVKVRDAAGCIQTLVVEIPLDTSVYVPNFFTPNADNVNDDFEVLNLPLSGTHKLIITNRWGNEVFKSNDYRDGNFWDANDVSDGVYYYRLKVDGGETFSGWVEVLRGSKP